MMFIVCHSRQDMSVNCNEVTTPCFLLFADSLVLKQSEDRLFKREFLNEFFIDAKMDVLIAKG